MGDKTRDAPADVSVSLQQVIEAFSAPISEEQAWAVCHQCARQAKCVWEEDRSNCRLVTALSDVRLRGDGTLDPSTWDVRQSPAKAVAIRSSVNSDAEG